MMDLADGAAFYYEDQPGNGLERVWFADGPLDDEDTTITLLAVSTSQTPGFKWMVDSAAQANDVPVVTGEPVRPEPEEG